MVAQEVKQSPENIRQWSLSDLVDMVSDILSRNDAEAYTYYFPEDTK